MKKSIKVKGMIKVDKSDLVKIRGGLTCSSAGSGYRCKEYKAAARKATGTETVDRDDVLIP